MMILCILKVVIVWNWNFFSWNRVLVEGVLYVGRVLIEVSFLDLVVVFVFIEVKKLLNLLVSFVMLFKYIGRISFFYC